MDLRYLRAVYKAEKAHIENGCACKNSALDELLYCIEEMLKEDNTPKWDTIKGNTKIPALDAGE